jgi:hypothetical protein
MPERSDGAERLAVKQLAGNLTTQVRATADLPIIALMAKAMRATARSASRRGARLSSRSQWTRTDWYS